MNRIAAITLALVAGTASGQNLLNNPGFEDPLGFDFSNPSNWNGFFGGPAGTFLQAFNDTGAAPRSGNNALVTTIQGVPGVTNGFDAFTGHVQIVPGLSGGTEYEYSIWARTNPTITNGAEFRIEWQDAGGNELGRINVEIQASLTSEYQRFALSGIAPAGTARAAVVLAVQSFTNNGIVANTSVAWDDAALVVIPAPATAAMMGLGSLVALRRRR